MPSPAASGILKQIRICPEATFGIPGAPDDVSAYLMRRVYCDLSPNIATFQSQEIRRDRQLVTFRHGTQQVQGNLRGELSPTSYADIFASLLAGQWEDGAGASMPSGATYAAAVLDTSPGTITRGSGSWLSDGFKIGDVVRIEGSSVAANNERNLRITELTPTVMSVGPVPTAGSGTGNEALTAGTEAGSATLTVVGKKLVSPDPDNGGTLLDPSFSLEAFFQDQALHELYAGCKPASIRMGFAPSSLCTIEMAWMGHDVHTGSGAYFTDPQGQASTDATAGVSGIVRLDDQDLALVTGIQMQLLGGHTTDPVIGSVFVPFIFPGIINISGTMSILFFDERYFDAALEEREVNLDLYFTLNTTVNTDFLSIHASRVKLNSVTKDDGPKAIVGSYAFQMLKRANGGAGTKYDNTTISMQDSTL